ncbi:MAG: hypothetical protein AB1916_11270 [Thermodesulfobacteriota bacterium]
MPRLSLRLPRENAVRLLVCLGALLVAFAVLVYPEMRAIARVEGEIAAARARIEQQKILYPVYRELMSVYQNATSGALPRVSRVPLAQADLGGVSTAIADMAREQGLEVRSVTPDPGSLAGGGGLISVRCVLSGDLGALRNFYLSLGTLPSLAHVERLQAEDVYSGRTYKLDLWLALENQLQTGGGR